jgi:hypothetical protein
VACNIEVDQPVAGDLFKHVIEEGDAGGEAAPAAAVEIQSNGDPGFERIPGNFCLPHRDTIAGWHFGSGKKFGVLLRTPGDHQHGSHCRDA